MDEAVEEPKPDEYGHHEPGYDPRGPDFDAPHTPEREVQMLAKVAREAEPAPVCPVCGEVHNASSIEVDHVDDAETHSPE